VSVGVGLWDTTVQYLIGILVNKLSLRSGSILRQLSIGGFLPFSAVDYPGSLSAVVFCQGCTWRCGYCHNPSLQPIKANPLLDWYDILAFLELRKNLLDAVVFSGGEPTIQQSILVAMRDVQLLNYRIGLHTAGIVPRRLEACLDYTNWVCLDLKGSQNEHHKITHVYNSGNPAYESFQIILNSGIPHTIRIGVA
jgi:pyruvate formate lyase activating enzyme